MRQDVHDWANVNHHGGVRPAGEGIGMGMFYCVAGSDAAAALARAVRFAAGRKR